VKEREIAFDQTKKIADDDAAARYEQARARSNNGSAGCVYENAGSGTGIRRDLARRLRY
jgi:hypothetical protein